MNDLLLPILGLLLLSRAAKPKVDTTDTSVPTGPKRTPTGKVIAPWPEKLTDQNQFNSLWISGGKYTVIDGVLVEYIGPAVVCQWPQKFKYEKEITNLFALLNDVVRDYNNTSPNNERRRDELMDMIGSIKNTIQSKYNTLKNGCMTYVPGSSGAAVTTATPGRMP